MESQYVSVQRHTRRSVLRLALLTGTTAVAGSLLAACAGGQATPTPATQPTQPAAQATPTTAPAAAASPTAAVAASPTTAEEL